MSSYALYLLSFLLYFKLSHALITIEGNTFDIGVAGCHYDDSCPTYDLCQADDCVINCNGAEICKYIKLNVYSNQVTVNCVTDRCYQVVVETDDTVPLITLNGGMHGGALITYGTGTVIANSLVDATSILAHGAHDLVHLNLNHANTWISAINAKQLLIDGECSGECRPTVYTPIGADSNTTIKFTSTYHNNGFHMFSLRGMDNLITFCDGVQGAHCDTTSTVHLFRLYYGKDYVNVCDYNEGLCDNITTSLGPELDDYTIVYADKYLQSADFRNQSDNLFVYFFENQNDELYGPSNADISVFCVSTFSQWRACKNVTLDFSLSNNVMLDNWVGDCTIHGPTNSFTEFGYFVSRAFRNTYYLQNTSTIDFIPLSTTPEASAGTWYISYDLSGWQLQESTLYIGDNQNLSLQCRQQWASACHDMIIHSDLDPNCFELSNLEWEFFFSSAAIAQFTVEFDAIGETCLVRRQDPTCTAELAAVPDGLCIPTMNPSVSPSDTPSSSPTAATPSPSSAPSDHPSLPSFNPSVSPSAHPSVSPSRNPTTLITIEGNTFDTGVEGCHYDDSCPTYDLCQTDACVINCNGAEICYWVKLNVYSNQVTVNCVTDRCYGVVVETDDTVPLITLNGGMHVGALITYGTGTVIVNSINDATHILAHGAHDLVHVNMNHPGSPYISAINAKQLLIDGVCSGGCRPTVYTPIGVDSNTTIKFVSTWHNNGWYIFSLRGTDNLITFCDGVQGAHCDTTTTQHLFRLYYGKDYVNVCNYNEGLCDNITTSLGTELDDYTIVYADKYLQSADFRNQSDNLLVYFSENQNDELYGPSNADISVFCLNTFGRAYGCYNVTLDFSLSNNAMLDNWVYYSTINGPTNSFTEYGYYQSRAAFNTYYLQNTSTINFIPLSTSPEALAATWEIDYNLAGWQLQESTLYIGDNLNLSLQCRQQWESACHNTVIHSDFNPNCIELSNLEWEFFFSSAAIAQFTVEFDAIGETCTVRRQDPTCNAELAAVPAALCIPTMNPSVSPSDNPSSSPTAATPFPSSAPTDHPSLPTFNPSVSPSTHPSVSPSRNPTTTPTAYPSQSPSGNPSASSESPSSEPSAYPSLSPTRMPSRYPSASPTNNPSVSPTNNPSSHPSLSPTRMPSRYPSASPTNNPSVSPSRNPSRSPSAPPSLSPTSATKFPSISPTQIPTDDPTTPYPTRSTPIKRHHVMVLTGDFDEFERYLNSTNVTKVVWAKGLVKMMLNVAIYPQLARVIVIINSVRKGSVIIDFSLQVDVTTSLLDLAEQNINSTGEITINANLTMPVASNTQYTFDPTAYPSQSPTMKPTQPPLKPAETHTPTTTPTKQPTGSPTLVPTYAPTTSSPSTEPTVSPTLDPTKAPTPQDIACNHAGIATETDGDYEYYLHIDEQSIVRFDTCGTLSLFDINIVDTNDTDKTYSCTGCGSICHQPSHYQATLSVGKYRMDIHGPHAFKMICTPKPDTDGPTASPTTRRPTKTPSAYPTVNPTTSRPTEPEYPVFNVSFKGDGGAPISHYPFLSDPYGRFVAYIEVEVYDAESVLGVSALCAECFVWQYRLENGVWTDIAHANNDDISVYNQQLTQTTYQSRLTIQSIRRLNAGRCVDEDDNSRLFEPGNVYELRLRFVVDREYFVSSISNALSIETNTLPSGGFCVIQDFEHLDALKPYNLFCAGWDNEDNLEYNALLKDVLMSATFVDDARKLQSVAPVGNVSITVMIKERDVDNAITCYRINAAFKRIADTINDKLNQNTSTSQNASSIVNDILDDIGSITNATSFSDNPDVAVSIVTVIEDIYAEELTTQNEAAMIVDDIVSNILEGSGVLDIVINVQNNTDNISWVVLEGEDIITELTTISTITSNEDIVDAETTTTVLVDSYLPQIFEAIDVFVDVNTEKNKTSTKQSVIQDQLYNIAGQSQQLIENLESTLQATLEAVTVDRDVSIINETEAEHVVDNLNNLAQSLVDYATLAASKALSKSDVGETFNYETTEYNEDGTIQNTKTIIATKFDANIIDFNDTRIADKDIILPKCGNEQQNIELPLSFMQQQDGVFDCAFMASSRNNFVSKQNRTQQSDTVSINIYNGDSKPNVYESNACFPYLITMGLTNFNLFDDRNDLSLGDASVFPSCDFWNVSDSLWDTAGCFVYNMSNTTITCGCIHLTTFSISQDEIVPEANILTEIDWKEFTFHNLYHYPTVWLTCLSLFIVFVFLCWIKPHSSKIKTKSIMAFEDIIYKSVQEEKLWIDIVGKEIKYITDYMPNQHLLGRGIQVVAPTKEAKKSVCQMQFKLFRAYLGNDHTLLSVFQRTAGTNFSLNQRLGCFFMYLCNIMVVTGTFYGLEQSTPVQDVLASFIISLCGTLPVLITKKFFQKSKPREVKSTKHILHEKSDKTTTSVAKDADEGNDTGTAGTLGTGILSARAPTALHDWDMGEFMERDDLTIAVFNEHVGKLYDKENQEHKIKAISDIRKALFDQMFPLPHVFKKVGWIILIFWSLAACITAIVYGFKFDIEAKAIENTKNPNLALYQNDDCWNTTLALQIEADLSNNAFQMDYIEQHAKNAGSYGGGDAKSWLLSILQSLLTSMILWQPLTVYCITWIKIWMFSWHLKMEVGPGNVVLLCKRCCCGYGADHLNEEDTTVKSKMQMLSQYISKKSKSAAPEKRSGQKIRDVVAHKNRPVDLISFLGNEDWIIDDTAKSKPAASVKEVGDTIASGSDSASLSIQNVNMASNDLAGEDEDEQEVELQTMTQLKSASGSEQDDAPHQSDQTAGGKSTKEDVSDGVVIVYDTNE